MYEFWYTENIDDDDVREIYAQEICERGGFQLTFEHGVECRDMYRPAIEEEW